MRIRKIQARDRSEWLRLLLALYADSAASDHVPVIDAFLDGTSSEWHLASAVFVCERPDSGLCGFLELAVRNYAEGCKGATPYVESWYVEPSARGIGLGRLLIEAAEQWALAHGFTEMASDAELSNTLSHRAHKGVGFVEEERLVHFRKKIQPVT